MSVSEILNNYNKRVTEQEICPKNRDKIHDYESINSQFIDKNVIEVEYVCLECGNLKYVYNYLEEGDSV